MKKIISVIREIIDFMRNSDELEKAFWEDERRIQHDPLPEKENR